MKTIYCYLVFFFGLSLQTAFAKSPELTLNEAFQKALKRSESVAITGEEMAQAQGRFYRAFDYFLPNVHFEASNRWQDTRGGGGAGDSINSDSQRRSTPEKKFVFTQPLFSGFKEIAALTGSGADKKQQAYAWKRAKELLFMDVMEAFYTVLQYGKDEEVLLSTQQLLSERLKELEERVKLGRSRDSEMKTSVAEIKLTESDLVDARNRTRAAKNLLEFYVGESLEDVVLKEPAEEPVETVLSHAEKAKKRSDVLSDEQGYILSQKKVLAASADLVPKLYLDGDYYTQRIGFQSGNDWDLKLVLDVPIEIGQTMGDITEAKSNEKKARLKYEESKRLAELDIRDAVQAFEASSESNSKRVKSLIG